MNFRSSLKHVLRVLKNMVMNFLTLKSSINLELFNKGNFFFDIKCLYPKLAKFTVCSFYPISVPMNILSFKKLNFKLF